MKTIIKNFVSMLRRFKMATLLNILGLSVAFAAFMVIVMQVNFEYNFDRMHPTSGRVYRVSNNQKGIWGIIHSRAFIETVIHSSPHIEAGALVNPYGTPQYFSIFENGEKKGFKEVICTAHSMITKVFDFPIVQGDINCLNDPEKVMIPLSLSKKLFGTESAIGKSLHAEESIWTKAKLISQLGLFIKTFRITRNYAM